MRVPSEKIHHFLSLLLAFCIPLERRIAPILIALLVLNWIIQWNWKEKISNLKAHSLALLPGALYILYCVGMLYSENTAFGLRDLETKMALLALPLVFACQASIEKKVTDKLMFSFIAGNILAMLICLAQSAYIYFDEMYLISSGQLNNVAASPKYFFSSYLSYFVHPSYFAMYLCLCVVFLFSKWSDRTDPLPEKQKILTVLLAVAVSVFIFLLASRMGIIVLSIIWLGGIVYLLLIKKYYRAGLISIGILLASALILYKSSAIIASRVDAAAHTMFNKHIDKTSTESSEARALIWEQAVTLLKENIPFGSGTGDVKDVLLKKYQEQGMTGAYEHRLNAHNQFLQTGIALGIPGLIVIIGMLLLPLFQRRNRFILFIVFTGIIILNFTVESMLEIQAGVIFYSYFSALLLTFKPDSHL